MNDLGDAFRQAWQLITNGDAEFYATVWLSLRVSGTASVCACLIGLPIGAWLAISTFRGRQAVVAVLNACLGIPSVMIGLLIYLLLSRSGPLGHWGLLFTPAAMIIAQTILVTPMVAAFSRQLLEASWVEYREQFGSLRLSRGECIRVLLYDNRFGLLTIVLAAFGRAIAEVGAVMTVGGNIAGSTRVMTTSIALETSKGDLPLALGLGIVLLVLVLAVTSAAQWIRHTVEQHHG